MRKNSLLTFPGKTPLFTSKTGGVVDRGISADGILTVLSDLAPAVQRKTCPRKTRLPLAADAAVGLAERAQTTKNGEIVAGRKPPLL